MIVFFDASALAKRYVEEEHSGAVRHWLERSTPTACRLSDVEISAALARRCREGALTAAERDRILEVLRRDFQSLTVVELSPEVVSAARAALLEHPLRAADAIQLASALTLRGRLRAPIRFLTFDRRLGEAARAEGFATESSER